MGVNMKNIRITFLFLCSIIFIPKSLLAASYHQEMIEGLDKINAATEQSAVATTTSSSGSKYFDPGIAEVLLAKYFGEYDLNAAAEMYDGLASKNQGYLTAKDFLYICVAGMEKYYTDVYKLWGDCRKGFIDELLDRTTGVQDVYKMGVSDFTAFNQSCTEPLKYTDGRAKNIYCISNKHNEDPAFQKAWVTQLRIEAPTCKDVKDGARMTCFGIAEKYNPEVRTADDFTIADAEEIAYNNYYKKHKLNDLPDALRGDFFSTYFNQGEVGGKKLMKILQQIVDVEKYGSKIDGYYGPKTQSAIVNYRGPDLRQQLAAKRFAMRESYEQYERFRDGWARQDWITLENGCHTKIENAELLSAPQSPDQVNEECKVTRNSLNKR